MLVLCLFESQAFGSPLVEGRRLHQKSDMAASEDHDSQTDGEGKPPRARFRGSVAEAQDLGNRMAPHLPRPDHFKYSELLYKDPTPDADKLSICKCPDLLTSFALSH